MLLVIALLAAQAQSGNANAPRALPLEPRTNPASWVTATDFPKHMPAGGAGVTVKLTIETNGLPSACTVIRSSGYDELDQHACDLMMRRARFKPPKDAAGNRIVGAYLGRFDWNSVSH